MNDRLAMLDSARALDAKVITLPRLEIIGLLADLHPEGAEYRELKAALQVGDGKLIGDLNTLAEMGYVSRTGIQVEKKALTSYQLTTDGLEAWHRTRQWLAQWVALS